ncbi:uncharacterized protein LOC105699708 isoform X2 [Orussus abietinus]|nr:uncharacterized protein LOC105699708 isoform X2 [Orussus abietinus]
MKSNLKCQPKGTSTLSCHLEGPEMTNLESYISEGTRVVTYESSETLDIGEEAFEMNFDRNGVESLLVDKSVSPWTLGIIRLIAGQLHVGADLANRPDGVFEDREVGYAGDCATTFDITRYACDRVGSSESWEKPDFVLVLPDVVVPEGNVLEIEKTRHMDRCRYRSDYVFGSDRDFEADPDKVNVNVNYSESRISISDDTFVSTSTTEAVMKGMKRNKKYMITDEIMVTLIGVEAAADAPPTISDPTVVPVVPVVLLDSL